MKYMCSRKLQRFIKLTIKKKVKHNMEHYNFLSLGVLELPWEWSLFHKQFKSDKEETRRGSPVDNRPSTE